MLGLIKNLKTKYGIQVQYLQCDNTEENIDFKRACKQEGMRMEFEYTAPDTPQQSDQVEL